MRTLYDVSKKKNFTPFSDSLFSLDHHPELMKKANDMMKKLLEKNKLYFHK